MSGNKRELLRQIPSVDALLRAHTMHRATSVLGSEDLTRLARLVLHEIRSEITAMDGRDAERFPALDSNRDRLLAHAVQRFEFQVKSELSKKIRRVINATGVVLHTNLGRAPLSARAREAILSEAAGYCTVEYDLELGSRGVRGGGTEKLLAKLVGAEDALAVNNCAAAALLILTAFARGGETVVSRGELVEIGGDFRIPDVMSQSGTTLVEVGTTNRTTLADYERAITDQTRLLLRVHTSNYRIVGFTARPGIEKLSALARARNLIFYEDAGSGSLFGDLEEVISGEPSIRETISAGVDVVSFSGDKLLGSAQAGLIAGRRELIEKLRREPLYRALRIDKLIYAALESSLESYRSGRQLTEIPVLRMLSLTEDELKERAISLCATLRDSVSDQLQIDVVEGQSAVGGGAGPTAQLKSLLVALTHPSKPAQLLEKRLRSYKTPVISRIADGEVLLDLRTVSPEEEAELVGAVLSL